jgi:hypothetical protein
MLAHYDRSSVPGPSFLGYGEVELLNPWWLEAERESICVPVLVASPSSPLVSSKPPAYWTVPPTLQGRSSLPG